MLQQFKLLQVFTFFKCSFKVNRTVCCNHLSLRPVDELHLDLVRARRRPPLEESLGGRDRRARPAPIRRAAVGGEHGGGEGGGGGGAVRVPALEGWQGVLDRVDHAGDRLGEELCGNGEVFLDHEKIARKIDSSGKASNF